MTPSPQSASSRNRLVAAGLVVFAATMAGFPFVYKAYVVRQNLNLSSKPLQGQNIVRGPYVNTGSRDMGPDPDWDPVTHTWKGRTTVKKREEELLGMKPGSSSSSSSSSSASSLQ